MISAEGTQPVQREDRDGLALIWLNRPARLNSIDAGLRRALAAVLRGAEADPAVTAIVLAGRGKAFCAGQDLKEAATLTRADAPRWVAEQAELLASLRDATKPTVAAWTGAAIGAGLQLGLLCDRRLAAAPLRIGQPEVAAGFASIFGSHILASYVSHATNVRLSLGCELLDAPEAVKLGLADRLVDAEVLHEEACAEARRLAAMPRLAFALSKRRFRDAGQAGFEQAVAAAMTAQAEAFGSGEIAEALRRRLGSRAPKS